MNVLRLNSIKRSAEGIPPRFIGNAQMIRAHLMPVEQGLSTLSAKGDAMVVLAKAMSLGATPLNAVFKSIALE